MSEAFTVVDWALCGAAALVLFLVVYTHSEGNRVSATRFVYEDIRRELGHQPRYQVLWRALTIAMGWQTNHGSSRRSGGPNMRNARQR